MKITTKTITFFSILTVTIASLILITVPTSAYAETTVSLPEGSAVPVCEETNECYIPYEVAVDVGETVTWSNDDTAAHTVTSGAVSDGPDGLFDSSLFMAGTTFSHTFEEEGTFDYFCMVHPWMQGLIVVQEAGAVEDDDAEYFFMVKVSDSTVKGGTQIDLEFSESQVNYQITATQNGKEIFRQQAHAIEMTASHMIDAVGSDENPIYVEVVPFGIGAPDDSDHWTGAKNNSPFVLGELKVVPEFGTIAVMILAVAIISIIAISAKSKLSIMPRL